VTHTTINEFLPCKNPPPRQDHLKVLQMGRSWGYDRPLGRCGFLYPEGTCTNDSPLGNRSPLIVAQGAPGPWEGGSWYSTDRSRTKSERLEGFELFDLKHMTRF